MPPQQTKPAQRAIKKIRTACLVSSLARGWQQWATENTVKHAQEPTGWVPNENKESESLTNTTHSKTEGPFLALAAQISVPKKDGCQPAAKTHGDLEEVQIKSKEVTKTVISKVQERGSDMASLTDRYEKDQSGSERFRNDKNLQDFEKIIEGRLSPCRRRKCSNLVSQLTKGWKEIEEEGGKPSGPALQQCRSDSLETEDSGYGDTDVEDKGPGEASKEPEVQGTTDETAVRIKGPTVSLTTKTVNERKHTNKPNKKYSQVHSIKGKWQKWADHHIVNQKLNPFSDEFDPELAMSTRLRKGDEGYGRPKEGSKTAERARRAEAHIHREIDDMCFIIVTMANRRANGKIQVTFGELFDRYVRISDKVVGILMRARKHGLLHFEGEMLWQGRDDHVIITLLD